MFEGNKLPVEQLMSATMRAVVAKSAELAPDAYDTSGGFEAMRVAYTRERAYWNEGGPQMQRTRDAEIVTPYGSVAVRFHYPRPGEAAPVVVYIHGGGFVLGNLDTHDRIMRLLADETGAVVCGVDYTLSPEAKFPLALHQCAAVIQHLHTQGQQYGTDPLRLCIAGDSGGAMLALGAFLYLRDQGDPSTNFVRALLLYYGLFGLRDSKSRRLLGGSWDGLTQADLDYYMDCYLEKPEDARSPYVDVLSSDLSDLPPAFIGAAELDPLRDDSLTLAAMLERHHRTYKFQVYEGVLHAFLHNSRHLPEAMTALRDGAAFLRDAVGPAGQDNNKQLGE